MGIIYRWVNLINGKGYTGKTQRRIEERERDRWRDKKDSKLLKRAVAKYGKENFTLDIIEEGITDPEYLKEREKYWIAYFDDFHNGYNQTEGGDGRCPGGERHPNYGRKWSADVRQRMSEASKGKQGLKGEQNPMYGKGHLIAGEKNPMFGRTGEKNPNYGNKWTDEQRQNQSDKLKGKKVRETHPMYGKKWSEERCQKHSQVMKGKTAGEKNGMYGRTGEKSPAYGRTGAKHPMFGMSGEKSPTIHREYMQAKWDFFLWYPHVKDISELRKQLREKFDNVHRTTIYKWTRKWLRELER